MTFNLMHDKSLKAVIPEREDLMTGIPSFFIKETFERINTRSKKRYMKTADTIYLSIYIVCLSLFNELAVERDEH